MRSPVSIAPWIVTVLLIILSVVTYPTLPERVPTHFGFDGTVTTTAARSPFEWMLLPLIAVVSVVVMHRLSRSLPDNPSRFNYPRKHDLLALPREYQAPVIEEMQRFVEVLTLVTVLILLAVQWMRWHVATGGNSQISNYVLLGLTVLMLPTVLVMLSRLSRATDEAVDRYQSSTMGRAAGIPRS